VSAQLVLDLGDGQSAVVADGKEEVDHSALHEVDHPCFELGGLGARRGVDVSLAATPAVEAAVVAALAARGDADAGAGHGLNHGQRGLGLGFEDEDCWAGCHGVRRRVKPALRFKSNDCPEFDR
jgi:hypothetical protein